ncbi:hypothetical protein BKH46_07710 [Helicobacter sp. 12S02634-8]|uniref:DUF1353 domain-containing protein n=1 Tax=Helicobacter sp. 12S02634-8 TaxID=1476199 RepID=UPI000BA4ECF3|nr:DUF1353 domain-containing protein [Helicobacter sp. 12S02634-8]PAF46347.1 hypothetical protein BKH46_07710 [Helicobacter sp. 12S02634-8]
MEHSLDTSLKAEINWKHKDKMLVILLEPIAYTTKAGEYILIPKGFESDGGSIPKIFWWLLSPFENYSKCCILHDYLCTQFHQGKLTRSYCDKIFLEAMESINIKKSTRLALYLAVRLYAKIKRYK